ncbi:MAG TPA: response regulator transcription factor [Polyangia bacterium]|jgi:DNA-binding NarL/FixJ family response regulator|nr:response regulator transcription factor [Polyangia bacterium]
MTTIRIAIASQGPLLRAGLVAGLGTQDGFEVVLAGASVPALRDAAFGGADVVVVVDVDPVAEGTNDDAFASDGPRFIVLAEAGDERIGEWLIDGCSVLPKGASIAAIVGAVQAAHAGLVATPPAFAAEALRFERTGESRNAAATHADVLTPRERQVLVEMSHGLGNREIGGALGISAHTAKFHVAQIIAKLDAQSRAHAVAKAMRAGLVDV